MILNERQYVIAKARVTAFAKTIAAAAASPPVQGAHPKLQEASQSLMKAQLKEMRRELRMYEGLKTARGKTKFGGQLDDMTLLLTQARIARGWSQRELGERLGVTAQQVQADEAGGYARASLERVGHLCQVLGVKTAVSIEVLKFPANGPGAFPSARVNRSV